MRGTAGNKDRKNTLTIRFVRVLGMTFIPMGILTFLAACIIVWMTVGQTYESYERSLDSVLSPLEESLQEMETDLDLFVLEYLAELTRETGHEEMRNYEMIQELGAIQDGRQNEGAAYLFDRNSGTLYLDYNYRNYLYEDMESFRAKLLSRGFPQGTTDGWSLYLYGQTCYLVHGYSYAGYYLGFYVDMNRYLDAADLDPEINSREWYVGDYSKIMYLDDGAAEQLRGLSTEEIEAHTGDYQYLLWESGKLGIRIALRMADLTFFRNMAGFLGFLLLTLLAEFMFVWLFWKMVKKWVTDPIRVMNQAMTALGHDSDEKYRIAGAPEGTAIEFRKMYWNFNRMAEEIENGKKRERQLYDMTLDNLKLRMNPHMLMNSLNLIYSMAQIEDYHSIQEFSLCMTDYFRYVLKETRDMVTVKEEMNFVKSYLGIQKIRFPNRFNCVYTMDPEAEYGLIPPLLIENFVENAVKYALIPGKVTEILINIRRQEQWLYISVTDTGRGIDPAVMKCILSGQNYVDAMGNEHIGIQNCRKWIDYRYRGNGNIRITSSPGAGTQIWIEVPYIEKEEEQV